MGTYGRNQRTFADSLYHVFLFCLFFLGDGERDVLDKMDALGFCGERDALPRPAQMDEENESS